MLVTVNTKHQFYCTKGGLKQSKCHGHIISIMKKHRLILLPRQYNRRGFLIRNFKSLVIFCGCADWFVLDVGGFGFDSCLTSR